MRKLGIIHKSNVSPTQIVDHIKNRADKVFQLKSKIKQKLVNKDDQITQGPNLSSPFSDNTLKDIIIRLMTR